MTTVAEPLRLRLLDVDFQIRCHAGEWSDFLAQLWAPFLQPASDAQAGEIEIAADPEGWIMRFFGEWAVVGDDPWSLANEMRNAMFQRALEANHSTIAVHAAVVARGDTGLLLCGPSGVGKSSLTLALLDQGWAYLSDDFAPIAVESGRVLPVPKPIHSKDPKVWDRLLQRWQPPGWVATPTQSCLIPATVWEVRKEPVEAGLIAFPRYDPQSPPAVTAMTAAEATARCSANLHGLSSLDHRALGIVARLGSAARSYALVYGSSGQAQEMVEQFLADAPGIR